METFFQKAKRRPFTFLELCVSISLISLVFLPLGLSGHKLLKKWQYEKDISKLQAQLQQAYNFVLHCDIPVNVVFKKTQKGLICALDFENKALEKKLPATILYPHIKRMTLNNMSIPRKHLIFSSAGDYDKPLLFTFLGAKESQKTSISLKGYPHVLELKK